MPCRPRSTRTHKTLGGLVMTTSKSALVRFLNLQQQVESLLPTFAPMLRCLRTTCRAISFETTPTISTSTMEYWSDHLQAAVLHLEQCLFLSGQGPAPTLTCTLRTETTTRSSVPLGLRTLSPKRKSASRNRQAGTRPTRSSTRSRRASSRSRSPVVVAGRQAALREELAELRYASMTRS